MKDSVRTAVLKIKISVGFSMISPYENLANAIVELAAKDYRKALKDLKRSPRNDAALQMKAECERFFRSGWYEALTSVDGEKLMAMLQREVLSE